MIYILAKHQLKQTTQLLVLMKMLHADVESYYVNKTAKLIK